MAAAMARAGAGAVRPDMSGIEWERFNYPPRINIIHFDLAEVRDKVGAAQHRVVSLLHRSYLLTLATLLVNFIDCIIIVGMGGMSGVAIVYSIFNIILGSLLSLFVLYHGYKSVVTVAPSSRTRYVAASVLMIILMFVQSLLSSGNVNGWANFGSARFSNAPSAAGYWTFAILLESLLWTGGFIFAAYNFVTVRNSRPSSGGVDTLNPL
eukprot:PLAT2983.1.p1 GENE.PLAT2983.1~~PLAT2983.1.p1  ORF type:complete len:209 (+),score=65.87 PLAT2983.1:294-920(+)